MLLLHDKGSTKFAEIRRVNGLQYISLREAWKACGLLELAAEWAEVLADPFRSNFVSLAHVFPTIMAKCEWNRPRDVWNDQSDVFITGIYNSFRWFRNVFRKDTNSLAYVL